MMKAPILLLLVSITMAAASAGVTSSSPKGVRGQRSLQDAGGSNGVRLLSTKKLKGPKERDCKIHAKKDNEVRYKCKAKSENEDEDIEIKDEIQFKVKAVSTLQVEVEYEQEIETNETETETETQYKISFEKLIEYQGDDDSEAYSWEDGVIIQEILLDGFTSLSDIVDSDDGITSTFSASSDDGIAEFIFTISRAGEGESLSANKMKIDFHLMNFPWLQSNSSVALISSIESKREIEVKADGEKNVEEFSISFADAVDTVGFVPIGEYSWESSANSTNSTSGESEEVEVVATSPSLDGRQLDGVVVDEIAFSFLGASGSNDIFWDPSAGVEYLSSAGPCAVAGLVSAFGSLVAMAFII